MSANTFSESDMFFLTCWSPINHRQTHKTTHCHKLNKLTSLSLSASLMCCAINLTACIAEESSGDNCFGMILSGSTAAVPGKGSPPAKPSQKQRRGWSVRPTVVMAAAWWYKKHEINQILIINYHADWTRTGGSFRHDVAGTEIFWGKVITFYFNIFELIQIN